MTNYGLTLKLTDGDLVMDGANRITTVEGSDKVMQDLTVLLKTGVGDDIFHTTFGLDMSTIVQTNDARLASALLIDAVMKYRFAKFVEPLLKGFTGRNLAWDLIVTLLSEEEIIVEFGGI